MNIDVTKKKSIEAAGAFSFSYQKNLRPSIFVMSAIALARIIFLLCVHDNLPAFSNEKSIRNVLINCVVGFMSICFDESLLSIHLIIFIVFALTSLRLWQTYSWAVTQTHRNRFQHKQNGFCLRFRYHENRVAWWNKMEAENSTFFVRNGTATKQWASAKHSYLYIQYDLTDAK